MSPLRRLLSKQSDGAGSAAHLNAMSADNETDVTYGTLQYVAAEGGNNSGVSYQEASGAPVEFKSPLGYHADSLFLVFLSIGHLIGVGVFATRMSP
jgi:hypothetical protein